MMSLYLVSDSASSSTISGVSGAELLLPFLPKRNKEIWLIEKIFHPLRYMNSSYQKLEIVYIEYVIKFLPATVPFSCTPWSYGTNASYNIDTFAHCRISGTIISVCLQLAKLKLLIHSLQLWVYPNVVMLFFWSSFTLLGNFVSIIECPFFGWRDCLFRFFLFCALRTTTIQNQFY